MRMMSAGPAAALPALALTLAWALPVDSAAQYVTVPPTAAYALQDVTVIQADGRREDGMTLVIRGRWIEAMGRNVQVPADAQVLEGDGLVVYPGFVDADGKPAHEFPRAEVDRRTVEIWNAPRPLQGFMPARQVVGHLTADGASLAAQRRGGLVAAAVHPSGAMMPGRGALLLYRKDATPEQLVLEPVLGPRFEFRGGQGVYPATLFGVTAFMRQSFEDAKHRRAVGASHARDPRGLPTPSHDADYAVLQEVIGGGVPVYFRADGAADILRVLGLADEYGFRPVIVGGHEAWKVAEELRRRDVPVLISMDFPEPRRWKPDPPAEEGAEEGDDEPGDPAGDEPVARASGTGVLDAAALREKEDLEHRYANAGRLESAGVTFALTSGGTGEVLKGVRKAIEHGLTEDAALGALTRTPARLLGVPHLVRLEAGMPATFVVASGPLFHDDTRVVHTFVEGQREEGSAPGSPAAAGAAEDAVAFGGEWDMRLDVGGQIMSATLTIDQDGATFTGSMSMEGQRLPLRDGVINGNEISAVALMDQGGQSLSIRITGTVHGHRATGEADAGPMGVARWTATRLGPGGAR
jgi:imidazolonepropionase-like amidohydrolase